MPRKVWDAPLKFGNGSVISSHTSITDPQWDYSQSMSVKWTPSLNELYSSYPTHVSPSIHCFYISLLDIFIIGYRRKEYCNVNTFIG